MAWGFALNISWSSLLNASQIGPDGHLLTFPVDHGKTLNIVAFRADPNDWPDSTRLTKPAKREDALRDFAGFGQNVIKLLNLTKPNVDIVSRASAG